MDEIENIVGITALGFQVWGFLWMLKYRQYPSEKDLKSWHSKNQHKNNYQEMKSDVVRFDIEPDFAMYLGRATRDDIPKRFANQWMFRKKQSVKLVIIGFILQAIRIGLPFIISQLDQTFNLVLP